MQVNGQTLTVDDYYPATRPAVIGGAATGDEPYRSPSVRRGARHVRTRRREWNRGDYARFDDSAGARKNESNRTRSPSGGPTPVVQPAVQYIVHTGRVCERELLCLMRHQ